MRKNTNLLIFLFLIGAAGAAFIFYSLVDYESEPKKIVTARPEAQNIFKLRKISNQAGRKIITFGASISQSGRYETEGKRVVEGYELWKNYVNGKGGIKVGGSYYKVVIKYYDDAGQPEMVRQNIEKLIVKDQVDFLLGPFSSGLTLEASKVSEKYGVILVEACGAAETIFTRNPKATFGVMTSASWYLKDFIALVSQQEQRPKTYAVLSPDKLFPKSVARGVRIWSLQKNISELYYGIVPGDTDNYTKYLEELVDLAPDIIMLTGHYKDAIAFTSQLANTPSLRPKAVVMTLGPTQKEFVDTLGAAAEGMTGITQWVANSSFTCPIFGSTAQYTQLFEKTYGHPPTYQNAQSSAAGVIYQLALENSPALDAEEVLKQLRQLEAEIFYGKVKFDKRGLNIWHEMAVVQIQNGQRKTIWPLESAEADFIYPLN